MPTVRPHQLAVVEDHGIEPHFDFSGVFEVCSLAFGQLLEKCCPVWFSPPEFSIADNVLVSGDPLRSDTGLSRVDFVSSRELVSDRCAGYDIGILQRQIEYVSISMLISSSLVQAGE